MPEKLYTAAQIGELMGGKSARTVRQMIAKGCFGDTVQDGKQHLVTESGYNAYIQSHTGPPAPAKAAGAAAVESVKEDTHGRNDFSSCSAAVSGPGGVEDRAGR